MKNRITVLGLAIAMSFGAAHATSNDSGVQKQIDDLRAGQHNDHMLILDKYSESWGLEDRGNIAKLQESKLDKSAFAADQARQDKALTETVTKQAATDAKQTSDLKSYADKKATSAYNTSVAHTDVKVARADADRKAGDDALAIRADGIEKRTQVTDDRSINNAVRLDGAEGAIRETNAHVAVTDNRSINNAVRLDGLETVNGQQEKMLGNHETRITQNSSDIVQLYSNGEYAQSRIDAANANIQANHDAIRSTNRVVSQHTEQLANHEQRIQTLEQDTNRNFGALRSQVDRNKKDADAGLAGVAAIASIPQVLESQTFSVGAGVGNRHDQQALAVGFSARAAQNVVVKVSAATDTNSGWTVGAGAAIGW